jgi:hypothetical protein
MTTILFVPGPLYSCDVFTTTELAFILLIVTLTIISIVIDSRMSAIACCIRTMSNTGRKPSMMGHLMQQNDLEKRFQSHQSMVPVWFVSGRL